MSEVWREVGSVAAGDTVMTRRVGALIRDESGGTSVEYALMVAGVSGVLLVGLFAFGHALRQRLHLALCADAAQGAGDCGI
jgi:Flp pilus assembly pilin Flp